MKSLRLLVCLMAALFVFVLSGCGGGTEPGKSSRNASWNTGGDIQATPETVATPVTEGPGRNASWNTGGDITDPIATPEPPATPTPEETPTPPDPVVP